MKVNFASVLPIINSLLFVSCTSDVPYGAPGPGGWGGTMHYGFHNSFVGLLIYIVMRVGGAKAPNETPTDIVKKRYARGEIAKEEYERMRKDLKS